MRRGSRHSLETRKRMSEAKKGKHLSVEHRKKISVEISSVQVNKKGLITR